MPTQKPRAHHYCPEFYLAGFTDTCTKKGRLFVHDREKKEVRNSRPKEQAHARDFYRVEVKDGADPYDIERWLSTIEDKSKEAIRHIVTTMELPGAEPMSYLLAFIGLLAVRTPPFRKQISDFYEQVAKSILKISFASEKHFNAVKSQISKKNPDFAKNADFTEMKEFAYSDRYTVETHQNTSIEMMLHAANVIVDCLLRRNWMIVLAKEEDFICSDNPVGLTWTKDMGPSSFYPPGFGMLSTEVSVPLTKRVGVIGIFEDIPMAIGEFARSGVASFNNLTLTRSQRFAYSAERTFVWRDQTGAVRRSEDLSFFKAKKD